MTITFWGVRGSIPVPGEETCRYGGNTACVSIEIDDKILVLDAGTGIRRLGRALVDRSDDVFLLISHLHSDHIQGFPFFAPLYVPGRIIHVFDYETPDGPWSPLAMLDGRHMPVRLGDLVSLPHRIEGDGTDFLRAHGFDVHRCPANHPGGAVGYRIECNGHSFIYMPDNELDPPGQPVLSFEALADFCRGADVLCHDAQYVDGDLPAKWGWGHSRIQRVCELAAAAGVRHLILFHHDPTRTDAMVDQIEGDARAFLEQQGIACTAAYEGLRLDLA